MSDSIFMEQMVKFVSSQYNFVASQEKELTDVFLSEWNEVSKQVRKGILLSLSTDSGEDFFLEPTVSMFQSFQQLHDEMYERVWEKHNTMFEDVYRYYQQDGASKGVFDFQDNWLSQQILNLLKKFDKIINNLSAKNLNNAEIATLYNIVGDRSPYWSGIAEFNLNQAKIFGQVEEVIIRGSNSYKIVAIMDNATCGPCKLISGTTFSVESAQKLVEWRKNASIEDMYKEFPRDETVARYEDLSKSPYMLPPFHMHCRCNVISTV